MKHCFPFLFIISFFPSCHWFYGRETSPVTSWSYHGSIPETPPGMILVEGGDYEFKTGDSSSAYHTLKSFYISAYEETNFQYRAYLDFLVYHGLSENYKKALPDTSVWLKENLSPEDASYLVENYFRHSTFNDYPVVGITPEQAIKYAQWKTDRLNEYILIREGLIEFDTTHGAYFTTEEYYAGNYPATDSTLILLVQGKNDRRVRYEDGILSPSLRLPTLFEWEYAALCIGNRKHEYIVTPKPEKQRKMNKKGNFDFLYITKKKHHFSSLQDQLQTMGLHPVYSGKKNNYRICNLYGNVSEIIFPDSTFITQMGGSWKEPENDYAAYYNECFKCSSPYHEINKFIIKTGYHKTPAAATGFRLAMDFFGNTEHPDIKRKKVK